MILIVGLGNPGRKFQKTRHNLGFRVVEAFFKKNRDRHNFSNFKLKKKFNAEISERKFNDKKIILAKPQTFMNLSGRAVKKITNNLQLTTNNLWVVHDDIDIPLGKIRISIGRGAAGHKGVESIIKELGTKNFVRFRVGIQPKTGKPKNPEKFVLQKFKKEEEGLIKEVIQKIIEAIEMTIIKGLEKAMNKFNK
ncbi:MAG: aminoacyl-tRNA hydrolase [Candidatus Nealsonbacteria bacterium CG_4_10_14_0_2_um_filter_37_10]|uniref:Peptidyl-tRNA hydrolase n=2 Tax=Candidatus Nealsoniibacteriota TaxID=1817911 RepID=A0A2M7V092_9BACT|nr:MAG: aminoacyl-tRNA hydrolase [Candidatus Nealsonbacteria bacterium CG_4_10_14_0_2_um_filter_37_10]